ncbi:5546_t:CDS:1 [Acaulospora morrowiae]|uniref:5546_t:CDS:1 n=1 Tax=Acaulospora morrowiae TaxID=94023 RepID=A0A9N8YS76_9GLOM|nr:5546_t:CDS:1 [Acaulospora morrowiae]
MQSPNDIISLQQQPYVYSWTLRGFHDLVRLMTTGSYLYSERFRSPRGLFDANLLCSPNAWANDLGLCHSQSTTTALLPQATIPFSPFPPPGNTNGISSIGNRKPGVVNSTNEDPSYLWRLRIYPNGATKKHNRHLSIYLETIQSPYEKQNYIMKRSVQFKFSIWRLIKNSQSSTNPINTTSSSTPSLLNNKFYGSSTFSRNHNHPLNHDSSKEFPVLVYESSFQKWEFEFHGSNSTYGFPTLGTFCELFPGVDINCDEVDLVVRVHIFNNNSMLLPFMDLYNEIFSTESYLNSSASFESFFNNETYYDVTFTFEDEKENNDPISGNCIDEVVKNENCVGELNSKCVTVRSAMDGRKVGRGIRTIKAHRIILVQRSEYFAKFLGGTWKDGSMKVIPIKHISFETFRIILYYLYTLKLEDGSDFDTLKDVYINADMMRLEQLAQLVADKIIRTVDYDNWDQVLEIGWKSNCFSSKVLLKTAAYDFIYKNWLSIKNSDQMSLLIKSASIECIEELMEAKMFGPLK